MMRSLLVAIAVLCLCRPAAAFELPSPARMAQYKQHVADAAAKEGLERGFVLSIIGGLEADPDMPRLLVRQPESEATIADYMKGAVTDARVSQGRKEKDKNAALLQGLERKYGVDGAIILAIYGVESNFGTRQGKRNVLRSLLTLAAMGYREELFLAELVACLQILAR